MPHCCSKQLLDKHSNPIESYPALDDGSMFQTCELTLCLNNVFLSVNIALILTVKCFGKTFDSSGVSAFLIVITRQYEGLPGYTPQR